MSVDVDTVRTATPWVLVFVGILGLLCAIVIKKIIGKVVSLVLAAVLIVVGWQQRQHVVDFANGVKDQTCAASTTFFGVKVSMPQSWCSPG